MNPCMFQYSSYRGPKITTMGLGRKEFQPVYQMIKDEINIQIAFESAFLTIAQNKTGIQFLKPVNLRGFTLSSGE